MSQKAIKKRTIESHKHFVHIPVRPIPDNNRRQPRPLPEKTFPLNKFIALPEGLRPKVNNNQNQANGDVFSPGRSAPVKAIPVGTSLNDSRAHVYMVGQPGGERHRQVTSDAYLADTDLSIQNNGYSQGNGAILNGDHSTYSDNSHSSRSRKVAEPDATSTPRGERRAPPSSRGFYSAQNSPRGSTPRGSINSVESSESGGRNRRYQKRSQSAPPENRQSRIPDTDFVLQKWHDNDDIPGLTKKVSYHIVNDGVVIQSKNWTSANTGLSPSGARHTVYRTNSVNSGHSVNTVSSYNTYATGSTDSTSELEFTDVCNLNTTIPDSVHSNNVSVKSLDFARSDTNNTGVFSGIHTVNTTDTNELDRHSDVVYSCSNSQAGSVSKNHKFVKSWSDLNLDQTKMDDGRLSQASLPRSYAVNGAPRSGLVIYRPGHKEERIIVNDMHNGTPGANYNHQFYTVGRKQGTLMQSKMKFSSMPTLVDSKGDKKLMKILKKQEKDEKKRKEKEEKKRAKEEKKRIKMEKKLKTKTLPRNFAYQHEHAYTNGHVVSPAMEKIYRRPMLSLSTVPIDFEDGPPKSSPAPKMAPPPPPEPSNRTMSLYASAPDLLRLEQVYGATLRGVPKGYAAAASVGYSDYGPRTVVLQRASEGYGFVLRGAKSQLKPNGDLDFRPSAEFPALQYLDSVDPGSAADRAGLKGGDFILEINGENVVRASHDRVVHLIRGTGDTLAMKVVTVKPSSRSQEWFVNQDRSLTMPNRKKKAPAPPQRDPRTSLSMSRSEGQAVSEELAVMESLDQAILEKKVSEEKKTASIRSRTAAKRVSCVELENIGIQDSSSSGQSNLERSRSTPNLLDQNTKARNDIIYATPTVPSSHKNVYAVPGVNKSSSGSVVINVQQSPTGITIRPHGPPPPPPAENTSPRKQAPRPPGSGADVVSIKTSKHSPYASTNIHIKPDEKSESPFESSFRPGASAKLTEEPLNSPGRQRAFDARVIVIGKHAVEEDGDKPSVSFAEDKVADNAASFLKKHPNAKLLITAEAQTSVKKRNSQVYEPAPDYDNDSGEEKHQVALRGHRQSVTVISVGDKNQSSTPNKNRYTIHSTIPSEDKSSNAYNLQSQGLMIPPRPDGPAPSPPNDSPRQQTIKKSAPTPPTSQIPPLQDSASPPPLPQTPPPDFDDAPPSPRYVSSGPPPPPPPPPVAPPPPSFEEITKKKTEVKADYMSTNAIPQDAIAAAVAKRQARLEGGEGPKMAPQKPSKPQTAKETNQAAILAAVAKRREQLEQQTDNSVVETIESRLQKTKKLQAAKFQISGAKSNKTENKSIDSKSNISVQPSIVKQVFEKKDVSVTERKDIVKPTETKEKPIKEENKAKPTELSFKIKTVSTSSHPQSGMTEIKPKFNVQPLTNAKPEKSSSSVKIKKQESLKLKPEPLEKTVSSQVFGNSENENQEQSKNEKNINGQSDFLALAEKKRQEWLQRKQKSPPESKATTPRSSTAGTPEKDKFRTKTIEIKPIEKKSGSPPVSAKPKTNGTTINQSYTEFQSPKGLVKVKPVSSMNGDANKNDNSRNYTNVPPPPPGFRDGGRMENTVVQLEIIPPPMNFSSDSGTDMSNQHSPAFSPDTASVVSSLSTLSSLSGDQNDIGQDNCYDDLIAPPPPGFDDGDVTLIPPPPEFETKSSSQKSGKIFSDKPVASWLCNDVLDWLDSLNMSQYKNSFQQNCIDGKKLLSLTRNNYIDLGITQVGHRMNIERSIKKAAIHQNTVSRDIIASEHL